MEEGEWTRGIAERSESSHSNFTPPVNRDVHAHCWPISGRSRLLHLCVCTLFPVDLHTVHFNHSLSYSVFAESLLGAFPADVRTVGTGLNVARALGTSYQATLFIQSSAVCGAVEKGLPRRVLV